MSGYRKRRAKTQSVKAKKHKWLIKYDWKNLCTYDADPAFQSDYSVRFMVRCEMLLPPISQHIFVGKVDF